MENDAVIKQLKDLTFMMINITPVQRKQLNNMIQNTYKDGIQKSIKKSTLEDVICNLQICVKYLLFDLEATTRERDYLKSVLDSDQSD